jgi:hypothetical protein
MRSYVPRYLHLQQLTAAALAQVITPWAVTGGSDGKVDYNKLVEQVRAAVVGADLMQPSATGS